MSLEKQRANVDWVEVLREAAEVGKQAILREYNTSSRKEVVGRGFGGDLTLGIDKASEAAIHACLNKSLGANSFVFVSEELGEEENRDSETKPVVICDPLDGSHNAEVGIPIFAVSLSVLGLKRKIYQKDPRTFGDVDVGFILSIPTSDEFYATKSGGAFHNKRKLVANTEKQKNIHTLLIECGDTDHLKSLTAKLSNDYVYKTRLLGSAAIAYCLLANGTADGFIFSQPGGARTIDSPAGYLIAREAGCVFQDLYGTIKDIDCVEVGFHSRVSLLGASNQALLSLLESKVRLEK